MSSTILAPSLLAFVPLNILNLFCQLSSIDAVVNVPPVACNNICPPSPLPPAGGIPTISEFSLAKGDGNEAPAANCPFTTNEPVALTEPVN